MSGSAILKVFRINAWLDLVEDYIVNIKRYKEVPCVHENYQLFVASIPTTPKWHSFLETVTSDETPSSNLTASFVLLRPTSESSAYAVTG